MDKREEAKINMARSVTKLLVRPEVVTATTGTPAIGLAAGEVTDSIALIENLDTEASAAARGDGGSKAGLRQLALNTALIVDGKITAWAARRDLPEVINLFNHERTDLARLSDEDFRTVVARILAKARELDTPPKQAAEEGLTTGHVTTLESRLNAFRAVITRPEDLQKHESALRVLIDQEFAKIDRVLDLRLDKLLRELSETHATDEQVAAYADHRFEYDNQQRVVKEWIEGGRRQFTLSYHNNPTLSAGEGVVAFLASSGVNTWATKTVETLPDGNQNRVYTNSAGQMLLKIFRETTTSKEWCTYTQYRRMARTARAEH